MASPSMVGAMADSQTAAPKNGVVPVPSRAHRSPVPSGPVRLLSQAIAMSLLPSPLRSPTEIAFGSGQPTRLPLVTKKFAEQLLIMYEYVPSPLLAVTRSGQLSRLKSAAAIAIGVLPVLLAEFTAVKPQAPSPVTMMMLLICSLAAMTSTLPSPLRSPTAMASGKAPKGTGMRPGIRKVAAPVLARIDMVLPVLLTVTRSRLPSRLKSPVVAKFGAGPTNSVLVRVNP